MNTTLLNWAVENNIALYESVLGAHGIHGRRTAGWWSTLDRVPPYYSNLVTRIPEPSAQLYLHLDSLNPGQTWALKDSFASLDLKSRNWRLLFEACWYGAVTLAPTEPETGAQFERVRDEHRLALWEAQWQKTSPAPGQRIFPAAVLRDKRLEIYALADWGGAIVNHSANAVGVSNLFPADAGLHRDVVRMASRLHPGKAIVGFGNHDDLITLGFKPLGPLRVWQSPVTADTKDHETF